ncbi:MAG: hypothetical protein JNK85_15165 [Verrucomicrobiales bacterium]|nr:hypothetical protein [Verrucomicrobiales bacterium]
MSPKYFIMIIAGPLWVSLGTSAGPAKYLPLDGPPPLRFLVAHKPATPPTPLPPLPEPPAPSTAGAGGAEPAATEVVAATLPTPGPGPETNAPPVEVKSGEPEEARPLSPPPVTLSPQALIPFFTVPAGNAPSTTANAVVAAPVTFVPPQLSTRSTSRATYTKSP